MRFVQACWTVVVPLLLIIVAAMVLLLGFQQRNAAFVVSYLGTTVVMLGNVLYIVFWHSRSRWPETTWVQRLTKVVWHER